MGDKIIVMARRIDKERNPVTGSGKHRAQRAIAKRNARAWIDIAVSLPQKSSESNDSDEADHPEFDEWTKV